MLTANCEVYIKKVYNFVPRIEGPVGATQGRSLPILR
jgi:hypothetical protein